MLHVSLFIATLYYIINMPRVLRILNRLIIGGPTLNAAYLTKYMAPGWETMLVIGGKDDHEQDAVHLTDRLGIEPVVVAEMKRAIQPGQDRAAYKKIKQLIKDFRPDVVHTHAAKSGAIGRLAAAACNVPVVVHTFHGHIFHSYFGKARSQVFIQIERYLARRSSGIIAISDLQKTELTGVYKICPAEKVHIIPLGFDLDLFSDDPVIKRLVFRRRYQITDNEIAIGIIGRIVPVKNHALFVAAAAKVLQTYPAKAPLHCHRRWRYAYGDGGAIPFGRDRLCLLSGGKPACAGHLHLLADGDG